MLKSARIPLVMANLLLRSIYALQFKPHRAMRLDLECAEGLENIVSEQVARNHRKRAVNWAHGGLSDHEWGREWDQLHCNNLL